MKATSRSEKKQEVNQPPALPTKQEPNSSSQAAPPSIETGEPLSTEAEESGENGSALNQQHRVDPKIGLILGGGGLRSYAHIGVLQEMSKRKFPIVAIGGIEMGALVAAVYSVKAQSFDVEWQMMKLKEKDLLQKGLISGKTKSLDVQVIDEFTNMVFGSLKVEQSKIPFTCPSLNIEQQKIYVLTKGSFKEMLPYCMAMPPLFKPYQQNVAGILSHQVVADQLRQRGANYIIYIDVLTAPIKTEDAEIDSQIVWSLAAEKMNQKLSGIDYTIRVPLRGYDLLDFNKRREMLQKGQMAAQAAIKVLEKELDL